MSSEPLPHFVDDYLGHLYETQPTAATFDGVHAYDDHLEDFSRSAIERHTRELGGFARRLTAIDPAALTPTERIERPMIEAHIRARIHDLESVRSWERNPQLYGALLVTGLAGQMLFAYAPIEQRARRVLSKLRQTPRLIQSARDNIKDPPGILVKAGLEALRGTLQLVERDLPRSFGAVDDLHLLGDLADASAEASAALAAYADHLEHELAPRARASFRLGRERLEQKLRLEEGVTLDADRLLAIAMRELRATQEEFRRVAAGGRGEDAMAIWRRLKREHPSPGALVDAARRQVDDVHRYVERNAIVSLPDGDKVQVAATPGFYRWTFASMWTPGPFEPRPLGAYYYLTDADPAWPATRQEEHLREFNYGALWAITIHEVFPGHFLHYQHLRQIRSRLRKSVLLASSSLVEGWAHYCEQMMVEEGFGGGDRPLKLGQLAEALIRLCRLVVGIRLHAEDMSVEQGVRFFREEAFMEEPSARREAERGTFDPSYVVYSLGKLMLLKLRAEWKARAGPRFSLREFHDTLLGNGTAPFWVHRRLMLGEEGTALD
jgi:uncharacterized protein (DUF885 family)